MGTVAVVIPAVFFFVVFVSLGIFVCGCDLYLLLVRRDDIGVSRSFVKGSLC